MERDPCVSVLDVCSALNEKAARQVNDIAALRARKAAVLQQIKQQANTSPGVVPSGE